MVDEKGGAVILRNNKLGYLPIEYNQLGKEEKADYIEVKSLFLPKSTSK